MSVFQFANGSIVKTKFVKYVRCEGNVLYVYTEPHDTLIKCQYHTEEAAQHESDLLYAAMVGDVPWWARPMGKMRECGRK